VNHKKQLKKAYASKKKNIAGNSKGSDLGSINGAAMEVHTAGTSLVDNNMTNITASTTGTTDDMNTQGMEDNPLDPGICHESAFPGTVSSIQQPAELFQGLYLLFSNQQRVLRMIYLNRSEFIRRIARGWTKGW
jgi:hypothetical protein